MGVAHRRGGTDTDLKQEKYLVQISIIYSELMTLIFDHYQRCGWVAVDRV